MTDDTGDSGNLVDPRLQRSIYLITELAHCLMSLPKDDTSAMVHMAEQCIHDAMEMHSKMHDETQEQIKEHGGWDQVPDDFKRKMQRTCAAEAQEWITCAAAMACAAAWNPACSDIHLDPEMLTQMREMTTAMSEFNEREQTKEGGDRKLRSVK